MALAKVRKTVKRRAPRWTAEEIKALVTAVGDHSKHILGSIPNDVSASTKQQTWKAVTAKVNFVNISGVDRTVKQVEHKWWDLKSDAKKAVLNMNKESGSNTVKPLDIHYMIIDIIDHRPPNVGIKIEDASYPDSYSEVPHIYESPLPSEAPLLVPYPGPPNESVPESFDQSEATPVTSDTDNLSKTSYRGRKRRRQDSENGVLEVQKEILTAVKRIAAIQEQQLEQMVVANDIRRQKLELLSKTVHSKDVRQSQPSAVDKNQHYL